MEPAHRPTSLNLSPAPYRSIINNNSPSPINRNAPFTPLEDLGKRGRVEDVTSHNEVSPPPTARPPPPPPSHPAPPPPTPPLPPFPTHPSTVTLLSKAKVDSDMTSHDNNNTVNKVGKEPDTPTLERDLIADILTNATDPSGLKKKRTRRKKDRRRTLSNGFESISKM